MTAEGRSADPRSIVPPFLPDSVETTFMAPSSGRSGGSRGRRSRSDLTLLRWKLRTEEAGRITPPAAETAVDILPESSELQQAPGFELRRLVNRGGNGEIWEAVQGSLGRIVAVKRLRADLASVLPGTEDSHLQTLTFKQEALTTASLEHPNIVPIYDLGLDADGRPLLAMKMIRGAPWNEMLRADFAELPPLDYYARHLPILLDVAQAVAFAHSRGIVHRDIKPSQVMVGEFGEVLLTDWGLATVFDRAALESGYARTAATRFAPDLDQAVNPAGTPAFMAPEQTLNTSEGIGPWTDIWLLGGTLYAVLTGTWPHNAQNSADAFRRAMLGVVEPPESRAAGREMPEPLRDLCNRCLQPDPEDRLGSVREFIVALQDFLSGADKRRESRELTDEVLRLIQGGGDIGYTALTDCDALLTRAANLWPANPQLGPLREFVYTAFTRSALEHGDLTMAEVQARQIPSGFVRRDLLDRVRLERQRQDFAARERRQLTVAFLVLIVAFVATILWVSDLQNRREEEELRRTMDQQLTQVAASMARGQKEQTELLRETTRLRLREEELARQLDRALPWPDSLMANTIGDEPIVLNDREAAMLLQRLGTLRAQSAELAARLDAADRELFGGELPEFLVSEALFSFHQARTPPEFARVADAFRAAHERSPDEPGPLVGMGLCAARSGNLAEAATLLERATLTARAAYGPQHPRARLAAGLWEQAMALRP